ncbi:hypothetical protein BpHYR1_006064 [Brachionus plicatilis]|uniref:Uncharacterized protein n=1 Tax=Brachionus plicatilis TaxID=10195 RepID=A0A3M7RCY5_BRAPC|nr:hypothetical protein BpHYR1_006064 [Brachionus plicatilis]
MGVCRKNVKLALGTLVELAVRVISLHREYKKCIRNNFKNKFSVMKAQAETSDSSYEIGDCIKCKIKIGSTNQINIFELKSLDIFNKNPGELFKEVDEHRLDQIVEKSSTSDEIAQSSVNRHKRINDKTKIPLSKSFDSLTIKDNVL